MNIVTSADQAGIGISGSECPNITGKVYGPNKLQCLNPAAFSVPAAGTFGNLGAYAIYLPFWVNWDVSLQ